MTIPLDRITCETLINNAVKASQPARYNDHRLLYILNFFDYKQRRTGLLHRITQNRQPIKKLLPGHPEVAFGDSN